MKTRFIVSDPQIPILLQCPEFSAKFGRYITVLGNFPISELQTFLLELFCTYWCFSGIGDEHELQAMEICKSKDVLANLNGPLNNWLGVIITEFKMRGIFLICCVYMPVYS